MIGRVEAIHLATRAGEPVFPAREVQAVEGMGLEGDRLFNAARELGQTVQPKKHVTLIEAEALEALARDYELELSPGESRRNICTRGVALNHLIGREFRIGEAILRGVELCEPCGTLERLAGRKGLVKGLIHRGGLRAQVVQSGLIRVHDAVTAL